MTAAKQRINPAHHKSGVDRRTGPPSIQVDVRGLRMSMGLTQEQFAKRLHVTPLTVSRWESGQSKPRRLALTRLRELEEEASIASASRHVPQTPQVRAAPPLDFAGDPDAVSAVAEAWRLAYGHQFNPAFASEISRIHPLPHQRIAVYEHMLPQEPLRFLLADDAGAGKTIMTGLTVREMLSRGRIRRVLVVPPAGLVGNWEREMRALFRLQFRIVTGSDARVGNPFRGPDSDLAIISLDTLVGERLFAKLCSAETPAYDLVVFDEAHKLSASTENRRTRKTRRYQLAEALAGCGDPDGDFGGLPWSSRHLLLLTATPHMGKDSPYHHLWRLLDPHVFTTSEAYRRFPAADRCRHFIRRTKEEMLDLAGKPLYRRRSCDTFGYALSLGPEGEQALYGETTNYLIDTYGRTIGNRGAARLAMGVFQRRLASSAWALSRSFQRRIGKLEGVVEDLRTGRLTSANLRQRQSKLDGRYRRDFFDDHGADEDARDDGAREANEDYEMAVLGAVVSVSIEELEEEIETLKGLDERAVAILDSGSESKFEKLREVLEDPRHVHEKWLIFSEHRDTMDYLVRRLEGLGHAGRVAQIHGGMNWPERDRQVRRFRRPGGARYLVATDAAGEGINLQFCAFMANYDIPWNPARLEQRMGRIHRYGQTRDVRIVNLVATSTREGRVLEVLLEKLEAVRRELDSDKVFDVIGRLFENASLTDYMTEALTDEGERNAVARIGDTVSGERVHGVEAAKARAYGPTGDVAARLERLRTDMQRERYLQLLPGYVRRFVEKSASLLDLDIRGDLDGYFSLAPRRAGALDGLLPVLADYPAEARKRLCVHRVEPGADCIWLHPGEPVFDALAAQVIDRFAHDAKRGGIFIDPKAEEPYLFHLAIASVEIEAAVGAPRQVLEHRLLAARQTAEGEPEESIVEPLLLLHGGGHVAPGAIPLASRGIALRAEAAGFLGEFAQAQLVGERRDALRLELPQRRRQVSAGFDLSIAELAGQRARLAKSNRNRRNAKVPINATDAAAAAEEFDAVKRRQRSLTEEKARALAALESEPDRIVPGSVRFILHALAVPATGADEGKRYDETVEQIAVRIASAWENERGADVLDVSKPALARAAGLPDWPGFDLLATQRGGETRHIEVKGRAGREAIQVEVNEWKQACNLGADYWLYVVLNCATPSPRLVRVRDPFSKLFAAERETRAYAISAKSLFDAAEPGS